MLLTLLGCVIVVLLSLAAPVQSQPELRLGPNGLGTSALGMTAQQVERAISHALVIEPRKRKNGGAALHAKV